MTIIDFKAPWAGALKARTLLFVVLLCAAAVAGYIGLASRPFWQGVCVSTCVALLLLASSRAIRGYRLTDEHIRIKRLVGGEVLPIANLQGVDGMAQAMQGSICLFANCGVFAMSGWYFNRRLKLYRAYATDPTRAVVLLVGKRKIVITPHDPQQFIARARTFIKTAAYEAAQRR